jgi:SPP1 family predicted phage head-tail adaptor
MRGGTLRHVITIRQRVNAQNEIGEPSSSWTEVATVRAWVQDISGREFLAAQGTQNAVNTKIQIRYRPDITPAMQVVFGAVTFNIEAVLSPTRNKTVLELMCVRLESP